MNKENESLLGKTGIRKGMIYKRSHVLDELLVLERKGIGLFVSWSQRGINHEPQEMRGIKQVSTE